MRTGILLVATVALLGAAACEPRPSEADCQQAVENINKIYGLTTHQDTDVSAAVRTCRAQSTKADAACRIAARTKEDVEACDAKGAKPEAKKD